MSSRTVIVNLGARPSVKTIIDNLIDLPPEMPLVNARSEEVDGLGWPIIILEFLDRKRND